MLMSAAFGRRNFLRLALTALALLVYFSHLVTFAVLAGTLVALAVGAHFDLKRARR